MPTYHRAPRRSAAWTRGRTYTVVVDRATHGYLVAIPAIEQYVNVDHRADIATLARNLILIHAPRLLHDQDAWAATLDILYTEAAV